MNDEEARKIASVLITADGECYVCAQKLAEEMQRVFPQFEWYSLVKGAEEDARKARNDLAVEEWPAGAGPLGF